MHPLPHGVRPLQKTAVNLTDARIKVAFGRGGSDQFDFLEEIGSDRVGSIYMLCFFSFLIDFDLIEGHLISDQVGFGSNRISLTF
jgi:hypothetical protein